jgi:hypothetical protein
VAASGAAVALLLVPVAPAGVPVVAAAGVALLAGLLPASATDRSAQSAADGNSPAGPA